MNIPCFLLFLLYGIIASVWVDAAPFYSLPDLYYFNGASASSIQLTNLVCVKGNNARSIKFQMLTSTAPIALDVLIGMSTYTVSIS